MQFQDIFIDLDNTILDFYATEAEVLGKALAVGGIAPEEDTLALYHHINLRQWQLLEEGAVSVDEIGVRRFALLVDALGVDVDAAALAQTYEAMLADACHFMPGAEALLAALAPRYRLHLVTNGMASVQYDRIRRAGIDRYFDHLFVSSDIGAVKPHAAFFDACFAAIPDFERARAAILGDVITDSTKKNLEMRVEAENGATAGKTDLAKRAKALNLDAVHDTVHEMARDEARHGKAFAGLLKRYFG